MEETYTKQKKDAAELDALLLNASSGIERCTEYKPVSFSDCPCPCPPVVKQVVYVSFSPIM
ncbi:MAG: hypothetical protein QME12_08615 [Nanoarchaeota archaeon]|nr:hypothetical protein [Nanoarchaeota archaeon]